MDGVEIPSTVAARFRGADLGSSDHFSKHLPPTKCRTVGLRECYHRIHTPGADGDPCRKVETSYTCMNCQVPQSIPYF